MATQCVHTPVICHYSITEKERDLSRNKEQASKLETEMESTIRRSNKRPVLHRGAPEAAPSAIQIPSISANLNNTFPDGMMESSAGLGFVEELQRTWHPNLTATLCKYV